MRPVQHDFQAIGDAVLRDGWTKLTLDDAQASALAQLLDTASEFFARPSERKRLHASEAGDHGFRAMGAEYSVTPERPDVNESMSLWSDRFDLIPEAGQLGQFGSALLDWQRVVAELTRDVLDELASRFRAAEPLAFAAASSVQVNHYLTAADDRECLQDRHEDGHVLTLVHGTAPGLEVFIDDRPEAVETAANELVLMPGSVLTDLTVGAVRPLYHQVRNHRIARRKSVMYFVNPELDHPLRRWEGEQLTDLREAIRQRPSAFGLPDVPVLE